MKAISLCALLVSPVVLTACSGNTNQAAALTSQSATKQALTLTKAEQSDIAASSQPLSDTTTTEPPLPTVQTDQTSQAHSGNNSEQPDITAKPEPQADMPIVQEQPTPESDEIIFNRLSSENFATNDWLNIRLDDHTITLMPSKQTNVADQKLETLRDSDGQLLGYIGYLAGTQTEDDPLRPDDPIVNRKAFMLLGIDEQQRTLPTMTMRYEGEMHYAYETQANVYTAGVSANYTANNKRVEMTISGRDADHSRLWTLSTTANHNGSVVGTLIENRQRSGEFDGGFYGKDGKILVGTTQFEDYRDQNKNWKGVVHTTAKE